MVLCGWDRPMQQYFLVIEYEELTDDITDEDAYIYSNLFDESPMQQELVYFQQKLDAFGIKLPKSMMDQVREDRLNNVGNRDLCTSPSYEQFWLSVGCIHSEQPNLTG